jgi:DNA-binding transcriptional regulator YiaG
MTPLERYLAGLKGHEQKGHQATRRLSAEQVAKIRENPPSTLSAMARELNVSIPTVWKIRHRITYRDLP